MRETAPVVAEPSLGRHGSTQVSFVSDFRYLGRSFEDLRPVIGDPTSAWLAGLAELGVPTPPDAWAPATAGSTGCRPAATVRVAIGPRLARIFVLVSVGEPRTHDREVLVPLGWQPLQLERLLPALDGDLSLTAADASTCRLGLAGSYRAPLGAMGRSIDRVAMHGLAESSVRNFLEEAEVALLACAGGGGHPVPTGGVAR